jgi:hypothetical protein
MYSSFPTTRTVADQGHVLRTVAACGSYAAHRLAAEERYEAAAAANARATFLRESGGKSAGILTRVAARCSVVGSTLMRIGEHLHGQPSGGAAPRVVRGA